MSHVTTPIDDLPPFDYLDPQFHGPGRYEVLAQLRDARPGLALDQFCRVNVLRYEDVRAVYSDHERFCNVEGGWVASMGCTSGPLFDNPDSFDIYRNNARMQLSFGAGIHRCTGAPLAQVELPAAVDVLLDRLEYVELAEEPTYSSGLFRGFESLHLNVKTLPR